MEFALGIMTCLSIILLYDKFRKKETSSETKETERKEVEHYNKILSYNINKVYGGE